MNAQTLLDQYSIPKDSNAYAKLTAMARVTIPLTPYEISYVRKLGECLASGLSLKVAHEKAIDEYLSGHDPRYTNCYIHPWPKDFIYG